MNLYRVAFAMMLLGLVHVDCGPPARDPNTAPVLVDGDSSDCIPWCLKLKDAGCREGQLAQCPETCKNVIDSRMTGLHVLCVLSSQDKQHMQACDPAGKLCQE